MSQDRTTQAVQRQLKAMGCGRFDIGIREGKKDKIMNRTWSTEEVVKSIPWLKRMNAKQLLEVVQKCAQTIQSIRVEQVERKEVAVHNPLDELKKLKHGTEV